MRVRPSSMPIIWPQPFSSGQLSSVSHASSLMNILPDSLNDYSLRYTSCCNNFNYSTVSFENKILPIQYAQKQTISLAMQYNKEKSASNNRIWSFYLHITVIFAQANWRQAHITPITVYVLSLAEVLRKRRAQTWRCRMPRCDVQQAKSSKL